MARTLTLYTKRTCPYCKAAKELLEERGIPYEEHDLTDDPDRLAAVKERYGWPTVPLILCGEELIGGFDSLSALDREDGLARFREE